MKTYPTGYLPDNEATILGLKSYRNSNGIFVHASKNIVVKGGLFADNKINVDIDKDESTRLEDTKIIGESDSYRRLLVAKRLDQKVCDASHIGVELHTQLLTPKAKGIVINNVQFSGFSHIPCNDAIPFSMDSSVSC